MNNLTFYNIICEVYKKDNSEEYNSDLIDSVNWIEFYSFADEIYKQFIANFSDFLSHVKTLERIQQVFYLGNECCNTPMSIPYLYWSDYCWNLLENSTYEEQINILNNLPCMTCREHAKKYIHDTYVDLVGIKDNITK